MKIRVTSLYDFDEQAKALFQQILQAEQTVVVTADKRPRLVIVPYERYRLLAERLAGLGDVLDELTETVAQAERHHPFYELKDDLIAEGVLDGG